MSVGKIWHVQQRAKGRVADLDPDPVGSGFQISLDPDPEPVSAQILEQKKMQKGL